MIVEIKHRWSGAFLFKIKTHTLKLAVEAAVKSGADLSGAHLYGATGANRNLLTPLLILFEQPGKIRAYEIGLIAEPETVEAQS